MGGGGDMPTTTRPVVVILEAEGLVDGRERPGCAAGVPVAELDRELGVVEILEHPGNAAGNGAGPVSAEEMDSFRSHPPGQVQ